MIDAHCHLYEEAEEEWANSGLEAMICAGAGVESSRKSVELAKKHKNVWVTVGVHPEEMQSSEFRMQNLIENLESLTEKPKVVAVGECGLDYHEGIKDVEKNVQKKLFDYNIELAGKTSLPLVVHCRNAFDDVFQLLSAHNSMLKGVQMHCWVGDESWTRKFLDLGCYLSFGGIVTFKNSGYLREVAKIVPEDKILAETDAPYLAPEPVRGSRNTPANVKYVVACLAEIRGVSFEEMVNTTSENAKRLFGI